MERIPAPEVVPPKPTALRTTPEGLAYIPEDPTDKPWIVDLLHKRRYNKATEGLNIATQIGGDSA